MPEYIELPLDTNPESLAEDAFDYVQANFPGWVPNDGNLDTIMIEVGARLVAEARDVASIVPVDIFRYFGSLVGVTPKEATFASALTTWIMIDSAGYTIPAGTEVGLRTAGDVLIPFATISPVVISPGTNMVSNVTIVALEAGIDASEIGAIGADLELISTLAFVSLVELLTTTSGGEEAESEEEYLDRLRTRLQLLAPRPILAKDFAIMAEDIVGVDRAVALDGYNPDHNLLTANQSSIETDTTGWVAGTNTTISRQTSQFADGVASLRLRSTASGDVTALTDPITQIAVVPGETVTARAEFKAGTTGRTVKLMIWWYNAASGLIDDTDGVQVADNSTTWTVATVVNAVAPALAAYARVAAVALATGGASEDHFIDKIALRKDTSTGWSIGGTPATGNERFVSVAAVDASGEAISSPKKAEVDAYLQEHREVNFVVAMLDPTYTFVDVDFDAVAMVGFDPSTVDSAAVSAVQAWLDPANWGLIAAGVGDSTESESWENTKIVRYLELAQVVNAVEGINYITSLTLRIGSNSFASADITLPGAVPLPRAGTITGDVVAP